MSKDLNEFETVLRSQYPLLKVNPSFRPDAHHAQVTRSITLPIYGKQKREKLFRFGNKPIRMNSHLGWPALFEDAFAGTPLTFFHGYFLILSVAQSHRPPEAV